MSLLIASSLNPPSFSSLSIYTFYTRDLWSFTNLSTEDVKIVGSIVISKRVYVKVKLSLKPNHNWERHGYNLHS